MIIKYLLPLIKVHKLCIGTVAGISIFNICTDRLKQRYDILGLGGARASCAHPMDPPLPIA